LRFLAGAASDDRAAAEIGALADRWPAADLHEDSPATQPLVARIFAEAGQPSAPLPLLLAGTNFQIKVWEALLRIPPGRVCTYEDIAHDLGQPTAARAVGGAVGGQQHRLPDPLPPRHPQERRDPRLSVGVHTQEGHARLGGSQIRIADGTNIQQLTNSTRSIGKPLEALCQIKNKAAAQMAL
jgi:hypothetical protein